MPSVLDSHRRILLTFYVTFTLLNSCAQRREQSVRNFAHSNGALVLHRKLAWGKLDRAECNIFIEIFAISIDWAQLAGQGKVALRPVANPPNLFSHDWVNER